MGLILLEGIGQLKTKTGEEGVSTLPKLFLIV